MKKETRKKDEHILEIADLRLRLDEAEEALRAVRNGEVDALVVSTPEGDRVFTLKSADYPYRVFLEAMHEGAVTLDPDGIILYCNHCFSEITQTPLEKLIGSSIQRFIEPGKRKTFKAAFQRREKEAWKAEVYLKRKKGTPVPVLVSFNLIEAAEGPFTCMVVTDLTEAKKTEAAMAVSEKQMRSLAVQLLEAQEKERKRIAQEVHDVLGSSLSAIKYKLEELQLNRHDLGLEKISASIGTVIPVIQETIEEVRRIQSDLRPPTLDDLGILATFSWFFRRFQSIYSRIHIETDLKIEEKEIPEVLKIAIFRIVQEAMNNIAKHAEADLIRISLHKVDSGIILSIGDNGRGFDPESLSIEDPLVRGIGLSSMKERTEISGGRFQIESAPGKGAVVRVSWLRLADLAEKAEPRKRRIGEEANKNRQL